MIYNDRRKRKKRRTNRHKYFNRWSSFVYNGYLGWKRHLTLFDILSFFIHRCGFVGLCCLLPVLSNWYFTFTVEKAIRNLMRLRAQVKNMQIMKWNDLPYLIGCQDLLIQTIQTYILEERMAWCPIYWHFVPHVRRLYQSQTMALVYPLSTKIISNLKYI